MNHYHASSVIHASHVQIKALALDDLTVFYQTAIGLKVLRADSHSVQLTADGSTPLVTLVHSKDVVPKPSGRTGLYHMAFLMPDRKTLGMFLKNIRQLSYPLIGASHHGVSEALYLEDPEGNGIEVYADTPDSRWSRNKEKPEQLDMVTRRLDLDSLIQATEREEWSGAPPSLMMGHIHLHVADLTESEVFYEALGFSLVQTIPGQAVFMSAGGYHHHIGFNVWQGKGAPAPPEHASGMDFFTLQFPDQGSLLSALKKVTAMGCEVQHRQGIPYLHDPSKNRIQCLIAHT